LEYLLLGILKVVDSVSPYLAFFIGLCLSLVKA